MSEIEVEAAKAIAVEAVRTHLQSVEKKKFALSMGTACALIGAICYGTWICNNTLHDLRDGQDRIERSLSYRVSVGTFNSWAVKLERQNRMIDGGKGLQVPDLDTKQQAGAATAAEQN